MRKGVSLEEVLSSGRFCVGTPDECIEVVENYERIGADEIMPIFQAGPATDAEVKTRCGSSASMSFHTSRRKNVRAPVRDLCGGARLTTALPVARGHAVLCPASPGLTARRCLSSIYHSTTWLSPPHCYTLLRGIHLRRW